MIMGWRPEFFDNKFYSIHSYNGLVVYFGRTSKGLVRENLRTSWGGRGGGGGGAELLEKINLSLPIPLNQVP